MDPLIPFFLLLGGCPSGWNAVHLCFGLKGVGVGKHSRSLGWREAGCSPPPSSFPGEPGQPPPICFLKQFPVFYLFI